MSIKQETVKINFNPGEISRILNYADKKYSSGHWGGGSFYTPEEQGLVDLFGKSSGTIELSLFNIKIICNWIREFTKQGYMLTAEDISVMQKFYKKIKSLYEKRKLKYQVVSDKYGKEKKDVLESLKDFTIGAAIPEKVILILKKKAKLFDQEYAENKNVDTEYLTGEIVRYFLLENNLFTARLNMISDVLELLEVMLPANYRQ
jgi:hypothetical protein